MSDQRNPNVPLMYRPLTQPRSAGIWGLTKGTTLLLLVLIGVVMISFLAPMPIPLIVLAAAVIVFAPLAWSRNGRSGWEIVSLSRQSRRASGKGEHLYRAGTFSQIPGSSRLPGLLAGSTLSEDVSIGGQRFAMIHVPRRNHYMIVIKVTPRGQEWIDVAEFDARVSRWGDAIAVIGSAADVVGISATVETVPETGQRVYDEVERMIVPGAPELAKTVLREAALDMPSSTVRTEARVSVTFKADTALRRRNATEQAHEIARRLPGIIGALERADLPARPMTASEVIAVVRRAYSPESLRNLEAALTDGSADRLSWSDAGPISATAHRDHYLHDAGQSITWEMDASPASVIQATMLRDLLLPIPDLPWKRVTIVYRPHASAEAVKMVDKDYTDATMAEGSSRGTVSAAAKIKVGLTEEARNEQAQGAGVTRVGMLITITSPVGGDMPAIDSLVRDASATCRVSVRRCYSFQDAAFAGGLGIGVVLPEHVTISAGLAG